MNSKQNIKAYYNTTLSQIFSPCGKFLVAGNFYGQLAVFDIARILNSNHEVSVSKKPLFHRTVPEEDQVCSLATTDKFLVVGTVGKITGWDWSTIHELNSTPTWTIQIPNTRGSLQRPDVNSIIVSTNKATGTSILYAGCGDKKIHVFSLEDGKHIRSFEGHANYIHSIHENKGQLASAGEDGNVMLWDLRQKQLSGTISPHKNSKVDRPSLGKWVGDVALCDDWLICGGGPRASMWHLRTMDVMASFHAVEDAGIHVTKFHEDKVLVAGTAPHLYHLSYTGDVSAQVQVSSTTVFTVVLQESPNQVMCIAGSSPHIDLCTNFCYRDQILSFM